MEHQNERSPLSQPDGGTTLRFHNLLVTNQPPFEEDIENICKLHSEADAQVAALTSQIESLKRQQALALSMRDSCANVLSPLRRLPMEILSEIFSHCTTVADTTTEPFPNFRDRRLKDRAALPFDLSRVCRRWRDCVASMSSTWSCICLNLSNPEPSRGQLTSLKLRLERAGNGPLYVGLTQSSRDQTMITLNHPFLQVIYPTSPRWRSLDVNLGALSFEALQPLQDTLSTLESITISVSSIPDRLAVPSLADVSLALNAPALTEISTWHVIEPLEIICPSLRTYRFNNARIETNNDAYLANIHASCETLETLVLVLGPMDTDGFLWHPAVLPKLTQLYLSLKVSDRLFYALHSLSAPALLTFSLVSSHHSELEEEDVVICRDFLTRSQCKLITLQFDAPKLFRCFDTFLDLLVRCSTLEELSTNIWIFQELSWMGVESDASYPLPNLRSLVAQLDSSSEWWDLIDLIESRTVNRPERDGLVPLEELALGKAVDFDLDDSDRARLAACCDSGFVFNNGSA